MPNLIAVFAAMEEEIRDLRERLSAKRRTRAGQFQLYAGHCGSKDVLVAVTGVGKENAVACGKDVLGRFPVEAAVSCGFAGGLNSAMRTGDVVVYDRVCCEEDGQSLGASSALLNAARSVRVEGCRVTIGNGVSVGELCAAPDGKSRLGGAYAADAVDMESYWIGALAADRGVPFITVRSIFDTNDSDVSLLSRLSVHGRISPWRILSHVACHPGSVPTLREYSRQAARARHGLAVSVINLIEAS